MKNKANILHKINSFKNNIIEGKKETAKTKNTLNNKDTKISLESANDNKNIPNLCITAQRIKINKHTKITAKNKEINYKVIYSSKKRIIRKNYSNDKLSISEKTLNKSIPKNIKQRLNTKKENKLNITKRNYSSNNLLIRRNKSIGNLTKILVKKNNETQNNKYEKRIKIINNNINRFNKQIETNQIVQNNQNHFVNKNCNLYPSISNYNNNYQNLSTNKTKTGNTFNSVTNGGFNITYNNMQNDELSNRNLRNISVKSKTKIMNKDLYNPKIYNCNLYKENKSSSIDKKDPRIRRFNDDIQNIIINNENIFQQKSKLIKNQKKKENEKTEFNNINNLNNIKNNRKTEINKRKSESNALINYNKLANNPLKKRGNILYQYILLKGNAEYLLRYCMQHRVNWIESNSPDIENTQFFNFKWKELSVGIDYFNLNKNSKMRQMVNHFEYHHAISNKAYMFINLMKYCEKNNLSVFKYVPFTIIFKIKDRRKIKNKAKQKRWMDKLEKLKNFIHRIDTKVKRFSEIGKYYNNEEYIQDKKNRDEFELMKQKKKAKKEEDKKTEDEKYTGVFEVYSDVFPRLKRGDNSLKNKEQNEVKEKEKKAPRIIGSNTLIEIPDTHFKGRNMWVLKAVNLYRGMCIRVVNSFQQMAKVINKFKSGVDLCNFTLEKIDEKENEENLNSNLDKINEEEKNQEQINDNKINKEKNLNEKKDEILYNCNKILIQKYIESPLLYRGRKCDMRIWVLLTHDLKVYIFKEGHLKTCSIEYDLNSKDAFTHITNYSFQKHNSNFQKFEKGNEVPFYEFQKFIDEKYPEKNYKLKNNLMKQIKDIIKVTMLCAKNKFCKNNNRGAQFEIFGYDFMMDSDFNVFLIEINSNPGLELSSPWIQIVVPRMLDDALRLTLDKVFEPVYDFSKNYKGVYTPEQKKLLVDSEIKIDFNAVNTNNSNNANSNNKNVTTNSILTKDSSSHLTYVSSLTKTSNALSNNKIFNINIELDDFDKQLLKDTMIENCNNNENKEIVSEENKNDKKEKEKQINDNKTIKTNKKKKKSYISPFPVPGYSLEENLWDYIFDLNSKNNNKNLNQNNNIKNKEEKDKNSFTGIKHLLKRKKTKPIDNLDKNKDV